MSTTPDPDRAELETFERNVMADLDSDADDADNTPLGSQQVDTAPVIDERPPVQETPKPTPAPPAPPVAPPPVDPGASASQQPDKGDLRPALRAARHEARALNKELDRVRSELDAFKSGNPPPANSDPKDIEAYIARVETDFPDQGAVLRSMHSQLKEVRASAPAQTQAEPDFRPEKLSDDWQELIDNNEQLLTWQTSKEHAQRWEMAKAADGLLAKHPAWQGKPISERLQEAVRRVNAELAPDPRQQAAAAIQRAPERTPETLSGLRGGTAPNNQAPDYFRMTDEQVMADLDRL